MSPARWLTPLLVLAFGSSSALAHYTPPPPIAGGSLSLSWDPCAPIASNKTAVSGPMTLYASVTNHALPHQAYQVWLLIGDQNRTLPDAWRFDAGGCNDGHATISANASPAQLPSSCPPFLPVAMPRLEIASYQPAPAFLGYATTLGFSGCGSSIEPTPARAKTWGSIKAQYKH